MKITYPLVPYPHTYIARFVPFTMGGGMCYLTKWRAKREHRHKHNTNSPQGVEAQAKTQEE